MIPVRISYPSDTLRWWRRLRRRDFVLQVPERWDEAGSLRRRQRWWRWIIALPRPAAQRAMLRDLLRHLPRSILGQLPPLDFAALASLLDWTQAEMQCDQVPVPHCTVGGRMYHMPTAKGANVTCLEYAIADDYYSQFVQGDPTALLHLVATIWREQHADSADALRRGDKRAPLFDKAEIEARAVRLKKMPEDLQLQALMYFAGLKKYVHRVYGKWIFEQPDEGEEPDEKRQESRGPDFGWWGILQQVAESGTFGIIAQVNQASIHEVCVFLVRKRIEADNFRSQAPATHRPEDSD